MSLLPNRSLTVLAFALLSTPIVTGTASQSVSPPGAPLTAPPNVNLLINGDFSDGLTSWLLFATPDMGHIQAQVTNGVLEYYRAPEHEGHSNQAVVFQWTNAPLGAAAPVIATFDLGNSSDVRKRMAVLINEDDFSDLHACTFWLEPHAPMRTYAMRSHTTKAWHNTTISFYAASPDSLGGFYQVDNVSLVYDPAERADRTECEDPTAPTPPGGPDGPSLLVNGHFMDGLAPWAVVHRLVWQLTGHVLEFVWTLDVPPPAPPDNTHPIPQFEPAPVVIQRTGLAVAAGEILTARVDLGNSSPVRKRVSVLIHQWDFGDLSACSFWLEPGAPVQTYTMRMHATTDWTDAALSVYAATRGADEWIQLDYAELRRTPGWPIVGTECYEPAAPGPITTNDIKGARAEGQARSVRPDRANILSGLRPAGAQSLLPLNDGRLRVLLPPDERIRIIEISRDGDIWSAVLVVDPSEDWRVVAIDLDGITDRAIYVRLSGA